MSEIGQSISISQPLNLTAEVCGAERIAANKATPALHRAIPDFRAGHERAFIVLELFPPSE